MRDYGKVGPQFWIGQTGKKLRGCMEARIVAMYLMTAPGSNMIGLYYVPLGSIAHETGLGIEGASKGLQWAIEAGFCKYDDTTEMVWVVEMAKFQVAEQLVEKDLRCKGIQREYDALPANPYLASFFDRYGMAFCMTEKRGSGKGLQRGFKVPTKPGTGTGTGAGDIPPTPKGGEVHEFPPGFDRFWTAYPKKVGKDAAAKAFAKRKPDEALLVVMLDAVGRQCASPAWKKDGGQFIPNPATWLNQGRWQDEATEGGADLAELFRRGQG